MATIRNIVKRRIESLFVFWWISSRSWKSLHFKSSTLTDQKDKNQEIRDYNLNWIIMDIFYILYDINYII